MNKINVNVLIGQNYIEINAIQNIEKRNVCIFNRQWSKLNLTKSQGIVSETIKKIEQMSQSEIKLVNLILDDFSFTSKNFVVSTKIIEETFEFKNDVELNESTLDNFKRSVLEKLNQDNSEFKLFSLIPFKFTVNNNSSNNLLTYSTFPFGIKASKIKCLFSVRFINSLMYSKLLEIFSNVDIEFENVILFSQLSIYKNENLSHSNTMNFTFDIQEKQSLLITSINDVVIATDKLGFSYNNLVEKISKKFDVSIDEAINIISCYGKINVLDDEKNEIVHLSNDESKLITKDALASVIKSFLKTLALDVDKIIRVKTNDLTKKYQVNIVGKLENIEDIEKYCSKYIGDNSNSISLGLKQNSFFFNQNYEIIKTIIIFLEVVKNKIQNKYLSKNNHVKVDSSQHLLKKQSIFNKSSKKRLQHQNPVLV